jgi:hypothetical protein
MLAGRPLGGRPAWGPSIGACNSPTTEGAFVGVVWGEGGDGMTNQGGQPSKAGISEWVEHLFRAVWRRLFMGGGDV